MKFEDRKIILKNGLEMLLCPTSADYAFDLIEYMKITAAETAFLLRYPDEVTYTIEAEKELLNHILDDEKSVMMMALVDGKVVGNCSINSIGAKRRIMHRCSLAIALKKEFWGIGIGTAMLEYLIELTIRIGYEQIELEVVDGNDNAIRLYEKAGFIESGRHVKALKYDDGTYKDELIMYKKLL